MLTMEDDCMLVRFPSYNTRTEREIDGIMAVWRLETNYKTELTHGGDGLGALAALHLARLEQPPLFLMPIQLLQQHDAIYRQPW